MHLTDTYTEGEQNKKEKDTNLQLRWEIYNNEKILSNRRQKKNQKGFRWFKQY